MNADRREEPDARASQDLLVKNLCTKLGAELIETHISYVLLAGERAYKIKKALDLGFLNFTTLASRRFYCAEELRLNRRLAPQIYLDLVAIGGSAAAPEIREEEAADAVDYAVRMQRFSQDALFDSMVLRGQLAAVHIDALAAVMASFHGGAARAGEHDRYGRGEDIEAPMRQNFEQIRGLAVAAGSVERLDAVESWSRQQHAKLVGVFEARRLQGYVRECHGDLHLGNVAWVDAAALPFDGIEFNAQLRWIDVMSEIAFLLMDLHWRRQSGLAWRFLSAYLERSGDYGGLTVLDVYLVYRAMVRAKIAAIRAGQDGVDGEAREVAARDYAEHLDLAQRLSRPHRPALLLMHGYSGSGKSAVARALVEAGGLVHLRSDVERKRLSGLSAEARSGSALNAGLYQEDMTCRTYQELARLARLVLAAGWPLVVDATTLRRWQRDPFRQLAAELGVPFLIVDCHADPDLLRSRVARRAARGDDASEADLKVLAQQLASHAAADALGEDEPAVRVDTGREEVAARTARVLRAIPNIACAPK